MNVLFISPSSPRESVGGIERYIINLIDYSKEQSDINVKIMLPTFSTESVENDSNVKMFFNNDLAITPYMSSIQISKKARSFSEQVKKIIIDEKIDIICAENFHIGFPPAYSILLNMVAVLHKIPLVLRIHSFAVTDLQKELINQLMWNKISCVSLSVAGDCFTKGANVNNLSTEYLGVNTKIFNEKIQKQSIREDLGFSKKNKIILTACRILSGRRIILAEKGIINLIEAFSRIAPRHDELRLLIAVGRPPESLSNEFDEALERLKGYTLLRRVSEKTVIKIFNLDEMPNVYRESDLFVLASENETFGQVFIESMACGLPVIGSKVGGIPEIIRDSHSGYLVPPRDSSYLAQKIEYILSNNSTRDKFIKSARKSIQDKFTLEAQFSSFMKSLRKIILSEKDKKP